GSTHETLTTPLIAYEPNATQQEPHSSPTRRSSDLAGHYHWIAHFTGDDNNNPVDGQCEEAGENTEVEKATPKLSTSATGSVTVGEEEHTTEPHTLTNLASRLLHVNNNLYKGERSNH